MFRRLASRGSVKAAAFAGGVALSAYMLNSAALQAAEEPSIFVINGFYMAMREKFTKPGTSIYYYLVEWDPAKLSWEDFRGKVLGATDPAKAEGGSLRRAIYTDWKQLGLAAEPDVGDNGVHASASPFEAMAERLNWLGVSLEDDAFGQAMLSSGVPKETIMKWTKDPQVPFDGKKGSLFDLLEDLDYDDCLAKSQAIAGASGKRPQGKQQAFVFIKPHAVTAPTKKLAAESLAKVGISIVGEGELTADVIEKQKLIDNHYYAIANKASLTKPADLNPPENGQAEFEKKFGVSWKQALAEGRVYNAVDGCKRLGIGGDKMNKQWADAKKAGLLVKFGGGFYAGKIPAPPKEGSTGWVTPAVLSLWALFGK